MLVNSIRLNLESTVEQCWKLIDKEIEDFLEEYTVEKDKDSDEMYILTIGYDNQKDLDKTIDEIYYEMGLIADLRNCFIEADISSLDGKKSW